jgi:putative sigma-54 modulation protein
MEMLGHTFFFFTNADSGSAAVVYRRDDGYVGLIDASA